MKANELMIGDYVLYQAHPNRVYRILPATVPFADIGRAKEDLLHIVWHSGRNDVHDQVNVQDVEPIPITPEILEKNGFKKSEVFVEWKYENDNVYMIYKPFPYFRIQMEDCIVAFPCEYVHELQHALRLCGIEKEIQL